MTQHKKFILTPISNILLEAISATRNIGNGINTFPLSEYIMQSIFIKMTGAQEQKMKCLMWEMAHNDFDFRYEFLKSSHGEYSLYKHKQIVYKSIIEQIMIVDKTFSVNEIDKDTILSSSKLENLLNNKTLIIWSEKSYFNYKKLWGEVKTEYFANQKTILLEDTTNGSISLRKVYIDHLYRNRNRIAHNTKSYQHNLPTLNALKNENYIFENYFLWFSILILIDHIFIELYKRYLETLTQKKLI